MSSGPRLWLKASPQGKRSGFVVLPDGAGGQLSVTVLPKPWASQGQATRDHTHAAGQTSHLVLYEGELVAMSSTRDVAGAIALGLNDVARTQAGLLELGAPPNKSVTEPAAEGDPFTSLLELSLLVERSSLNSKDGGFEGDFAPAVLQLLAFERLVREVEKVLFRARPRYTETTEMLGMPRGRLSAHSLMLSHASGIPRVLSTFDELTMDTALLRVIRAALRVVAATRLHSKIRALRPGITVRAAQLLTFFHTVRPIHHAEAAASGQKLHLGALDRPWRAALESAIPVLRAQDISPVDGSERSDVVCISISTEKVWEQCLQGALATAFGEVHVNRDGNLAVGLRALPPWVRDGSEAETAASASPDFLVRNGKALAVLDAKYKTRSRLSVDSSDGYQLFAYSYLTQLHERTPDFVAILRPVRRGQRPAQTEYARQPEAKFPLWVATLPFPERSDVKDAAHWRAYNSKLSAQLAEFATSWPDTISSHEA